MTITINQELFGKPDALKGARPVWGWGLGAVPGPTPQGLFTCPYRMATSDRHPPLFARRERDARASLGPFEDREVHRPRVDTLRSLLATP